MRANDRAWTEHKMGRSGPRRPTLMDSAWNQSPLKPGEVENDIDEKPNYQKAGTPDMGGAGPGGPGPAGTNGAARGRAVKFTSEPAAALKLIDTEKRGAQPGTCMAPLQYRAQNGGPENDSMMNPFAKPWTPQVGPVGQFQPIGVIQQPQQPMQQMQMQQIPQMQQGLQPLQLGQYQQMPQQMPQSMPPNAPHAPMPGTNGTMPNGTVGCFYATPTIQVAAPYTTMAPMAGPMPQVSMVMVQNAPMTSPQADVHAPMPGPMVGPPPNPAPIGACGTCGTCAPRMTNNLAPIGPPMQQMPMQPQMQQQMSMAVAPPAPMPQHPQHPQHPQQHLQPGEPPLGSPELPSKGSALHAYRACKPCAFFYQEGCSNKEQCAFCHLCEPGERKRRKKERRMARREAQDG